MKNGEQGTENEPKRPCLLILHSLFPVLRSPFVFSVSLCRCGSNSQASRFRPGALDEPGIDPPLNEGRLVEDLAMPRDRGLDALDNELAKRAPHAGQRLRPRRLI